MRTNSKKNISKIAVLSSALVLLLLGAVWGSVAYIIANTNDVSNQFEMARVTCSVSDTVSDGVKSNIIITNTGNVSAYIRAAIVANWCDDEGNIVAACNLGNSSEVNVVGLPGHGWTLGSDGFYYYLFPIDAGVELKGSSALFTSCSAKEPPVEDSHLEIVILSQAVQADGEDLSGNSPVVLAWGPTVSKVNDGGMLSVVTSLN